MGLSGFRKNENMIVSLSMLLRNAIRKRISRMLVNTRTSSLGLIGTKRLSTAL